MKESAVPLYLSASQAASELAITPATLYAYVSRGLVRSEPTDDARAKRYRADDVRALKARRGNPAKTGEAEAPVLDSAVSTISDTGILYRGVDAIALAETATLEHAATLLWDISETDPFRAGTLPVISPAMRNVMTASKEEAPLTRAIAVLALAGGADPRAFNRSKDGRTMAGARAMRLATAAILDHAPESVPLHRQVAQTMAPNDKAAEDLLRRALVLLADHELTPSTYAVRCAVSTGINLYDALVAGLAAVKGPRHGGAGPRAAHLVAALADGDMGQVIRDRVETGESIPGFGHTVYRHGDPRAVHLLDALARSGADPELAVEAPALIREATGLHPSIDFALAVLMRSLGQPIGQETALFAIARMAGWIAHAIEQLESGVLIRPRARYTGPAPARGSP